MALIACPECGQEVSEKAAACPKCAHPIAPAAGAAGSDCPACGKGKIRQVTHAKFGEGVLWLLFGGACFLTVFLAPLGFFFGILGLARIRTETVLGCNSVFCSHVQAGAVSSGGSSSCGSLVAAIVIGTAAATIFGVQATTPPPKATQAPVPERKPRPKPKPKKAKLVGSSLEEFSLKGCERVSGRLFLGDGKPSDEEIQQAIYSIHWEAKQKYPGLQIAVYYVHQGPKQENVPLPVYIGWFSAKKGSLTCVDGKPSKMRFEKP